MKSKTAIIRIVVSVIAAVMILSSAAIVSNAEEEATVSGIKYELNEDDMTAAVAPFNDVSGDIVIPPSIIVAGAEYTVTAINSSAFNFCMGISTIRIPYTVASIDELAFDNIYNLTHIIVDNGNPYFYSESGILFNKDKTVLIQFPTGAEGSYTVPDTVETVEERAFLFSKINKITLPDSVKTLEEKSFYGSEIQELVIGNGLEEIGEAALSETHFFTIILPSTLKKIENRAFTASKLRSIYYRGTKTDWDNITKYNLWSFTSELGNNPAAKQVTFKVANGSWDDGTTGDKVITVIGDVADKLIEGVIPEVGSKPNENYASGSWENDPLSATLTGDTVFTYKYEEYEEPKFTVTWEDENGNPLEIDEDVPYGTTPSFDGDEPTKQNDNTYIYTFTGWSDGTNIYGKNDTLPEVTDDATYTAVYSQRSYMGSVKFIAVAEDDRIKSQTVVIKVFDSATDGTNYTSYGAIPVSGTGEFNTTITHIPEGDYTYSVEPDNADTYVSPETGTFSITAEQTTEVKFNLVIPVKSYRVTFINDDEEHTVLQSTLVDEGETPVYSGNTPTKQGDAQYSYEFAGWGDGDNAYDVGVSLPEVTGEVTYTALFYSDLIKYTITWKQDDGTVIDTTSVEYGVTPKHDDPTKDADAQYTYTFAGWTPEIVSVEGEKTYTATYTATPRSYTITWQQDDGSLIDKTTVEYGETPVHSDPVKEPDDQYTYDFAGWDKNIVPVKGEETYTATFTAVPKKTDNPETGDGSLALLITGISSLICLGAVLAYGRKREKDN